MNKKELTEKNKINVGERIDSARAITLISLVITIILLIILAGIVINLSLGENGLFNKVKQAKAKYNEASARERLEVVLAEALVEKEGNTEYDSEDFLSNLLTNDNMSVNKNTVTVNNYNFLIDREKLKIVESLGETSVKVMSEVKEYIGKGENNKYKVSSLITIQSNIEMESIKITNPDGTNITLTTDKQELTKDIEMELDQEYKIEVKTKDGKTDTRTIIEKSEEKIRSVEDLVAFRDKVNSGLTYEGKTLKLTSDLDLSIICGKSKGSFEPIGISSGKPFKGIFDGNNHSIKNIFINESSNNNGLFGVIANSTIKNLKLDNGNISGVFSTGGIVGWVTGSSYIINCHNSVRIIGTQAYAGGICGRINNGTTIEQCSNLAKISRASYAGGIVGMSGGNENIVKNSFNIGEVNSIEEYSWGDNPSYAGGIIGGIMGEGKSTSSSKIENCYNTGNIIGRNGVAGVCACHAYGGNNSINNCYSTGNVSGNIKHGISSSEQPINASLKVTLKNNYWLTGCGASSGSYSSGNTNAAPKSETEIKALATIQEGKNASILGEAYTNDEKIKVIDEETGKEKEVWKYNNGYPILTWQKENSK